MSGESTSITTPQYRVAAGLWVTSQFTTPKLRFAQIFGDITGCYASNGNAASFGDMKSLLPLNTVLPQVLWDTLQVLLSLGTVLTQVFARLHYTRSTALPGTTSQVLKPRKYRFTASFSSLCCNLLVTSQALQPSVCLRQVFGYSQVYNPSYKFLTSQLFTHLYSMSCRNVG